MNLRTIGLLIASNIFMTFAWYGLIKEKGVNVVEGDTYKLGYCFF